MKKILKKNTIFATILLLFIIMFCVLIITNLLYTHQINNILFNCYIDSASTNASIYFQKIHETENELNNLTYNIFSSNKLFLEYSSEISSSGNTALYANSFLSDTAAQNNLDAVYIYRTKSDKFTASYYNENGYISEENLRNIIDEFSYGNKWFFLKDKNSKNGSLIYTTRDFSGFHIIYSLSSHSFLDKFNTNSKNKIDNFIVYYNDNYLFNSSYLRYGTFEPKSFSDFKFENNSDKAHYSDNSLLYINNTNYKFSIVSIYDRNVYTAWKLPAIQNTVKIFIIVVLLYFLVIMILYIISKKKIMSFNNIIKSNKTECSDLATAIIKNAYLGISVSDDTINRLSSYYTEYNSFLCIMLCIDKLNEDNVKNSPISDTSKILFVDTINLLSSKYKTETAICNSDTISIFIAGIESISINEISNLLKSLSDVFYKNTKYTITSVIGDEFCNCTDIHQNLTILNSMKQYRFIYGYNSIISSENTQCDYNISYPDELVSELIGSIIHADHKQCLKCTDKFFSILIELNHPVISKEWISTMCFSILRETQFLYSDSDRGFNFIKRIFECEILDECVFILQEMLPNIELIHSVSSTNITHFRQQVMEIIDIEYKNRDLNISYIADKMNITPAYWGQKFSKEFNSAFNTYLTNYRINKSISMLANTNEKISDIAIQCGFSNATYFTKAFREYKGMTPSQYRNSVHS